MAVAHIAKGKSARVLNGHPWIYRTEITHFTGAVQPGDVVDVVDHRGRFVGRGFANPISVIAVRLLTRDTRPITLDFFESQIQRSLDYRRAVLTLDEQTSCRLVFGEADWLPGLIVDKFEDTLVMQVHSAGMERWLKDVVDILVSKVCPRGIYARNDTAIRELEGLPKESRWLYGYTECPVMIKENGARFRVDFIMGQKTGYFLDQRQNRRAILPLVAGARVLDAFCYVGSFAIQAAVHGAKEVIGIDASEEAIAESQKNAQLNKVEERCTFLTGNVFDELRRYDSQKETFDVVLLDPPAFVKSRRALEGALRGYKEINLRAMKIVRPGGFLVTSSCSYHLSQQEFSAVIEAAAADAKRKVRVVQLRGQAVDHPVRVGYPESAYLKCFILALD